MAKKTFVISFEIKDDDTYDDRYKSLTKKIESLGLYWDETTSFYAVRSEETAKSIGQTLFVDTEVNSSKDHLLVIDTQTNEAYYIGPEKPANYFFDFV